jgi:hypothetical protein
MFAHDGSFGDSGRDSDGASLTRAVDFEHLFFGPAFAQ